MTLAGRAWYRVRQFSKAVAGSVTPKQLSDVREILGAELYSLFEGMRPGAQRHGYDVLVQVQQDGRADRNLWAAALLHDMGKGRLGAWQRVAWVMAGAAGPRPRGILANHWLGAWLGLRQNLQHAGVGARMAAERGASPVVVRLIERHYRIDPHDQLLCALQRADNDN